MSSPEAEDNVMDSVVDGDDNDNLFGSDDDDEDELGLKARELSDRELDSGDDEGRYDRSHKHAAGGSPDEGGKDARILESTIWRHPLPKPIDGVFNSLRLPPFLGIEPHKFDPQAFVPPASDHHTDKKSANFSASAIAASTMRYRKNPATGKLESNTLVYRWSDGSTTIAVGDQHYELQSKPLAPPKDSKSYQETQDSHLYITSPSVYSQLLVVVGHMAKQYTVRPNKSMEEDSVSKLQQSLAAATRRGHKGDDKSGPELITNTIDPELQKKKAEMAEKERLRAQRRRETAAEKANMPKSGYGGTRGGLNVDDLEGRGRRAPGSGKPRAKANKRRAEYDSDDDVPKGRYREDEYDKEDDFLASSDEDLEGPEGDDDEEEEELLDDDSDRGAPKAKKQKLSKPDDEGSDSDADAEADLDDVEAPAATVSIEPASRGRKRNIIEDDDDE